MIDLGGDTSSLGSMRYLPSDKNVVIEDQYEYLRTGILKLASNYPSYPDYYRLGAGYIFDLSSQPQTIFRSSATNGNVIVFMGAENSSTAYWSDDGGITINTSILPSIGNIWGSVAYGNGMFIAVSQDGKAAKSINGKEWVSIPNVPITTVFPYNGIAFAANKFVVVGQGGPAVYTTDGSSWIQISGFGGGQVCSVASDGTVFAAVYTGSTVYVWDGTATRQSTLPPGGSSFRLAGWGGIFVAVATGGTKMAAVSYDHCASWQTVEAPFLANQSSQSVSVVNGKFYAASASGIAVTESGTHWNILSLPKAIPVSHVAGDNSSIIALNLTGADSAYSNQTMDAIGSPVYTPNLYVRIK
ncbi:hypothetical protein ACEUAP_03660 [Aeromonas veronii]